MLYSDDESNYIYDKNDVYCLRCGKKLASADYGTLGAKGAWDVDRSVPVARGGTDYLQNLVPAYIAHNRSKEALRTRQSSTEKVAQLRRFKAVSVSLLPIVLLLAEFLFFSYFPLSNAYAVSRGNSWGVFTAYLVFDGWSNVIAIGFACVMALISTSLFWPQSKFLLPSSLLILTNAAGIFASLVWLVSSYSATIIVFVGPNRTNIYAKAGLGMSGAAFGALGFSVTLSILALVFQARNRPWSMTGARALLWRFGVTGFGLLTLLGVILAVPAFLPNEAELVHAVGLLTGVVGALSAGWKTLGTKRDQQTVSAADASQDLGSSSF